MRDLRRQPRYPARLAVTLRAGKKIEQLVTEDVSYGGLFLRWDGSIGLRQLVRVEAVLPPMQHRLSVHAMVVHAVPPENANGRSPGVGLQFYAVDRATRLAWDHFILWVRAGAEGARASAPRTSAPPPRTSAPPPAHAFGAAARR